MANYTSSYTGQEIDSLQAQITALSEAIANFNTNIENNYNLSSNFNNLSSTVSSIQSNYATKAQVNSIISLPAGTTQDLTLTNSAKKTAWTVAIENWSAPGNGWLVVYLNNCSSTPAAYITGGGLQARQSSNSSREFTIQMPVAAGRPYTIQYIYCQVKWAHFVPAMQLT